jgi:hypothetical protein
MKKQNIVLHRNPILAAWGLLTLLCVVYEVASIRWPWISYAPVDIACKCILLWTMGVLVLICTAIWVADIRSGFRSIRNNYPRFVCSARAAISAWVAWEMPEIVEYRKALKRRSLADQRDLERALIEAAHQQGAE